MGGPQRIWHAIEKLMVGIGSFAEDLNVFCSTDDMSKVELGESWRTNFWCAFYYLKSVLSLIPSGPMQSLIFGIDKLMRLYLRPNVPGQSKQAFCDAMTRAIEGLWAMDIEDWLKEYGQYTQLCPESVVDGVINNLPPVLQDDIEQIRIALAVLAGLIAAAALALMAALAAGVPAFIANAAYATAVASARAVAMAAMAALGLTGGAAADAVDDVIGGVEACEIEDPGPTDIGVEEEEKGEGCCLEGEIVDGIENQDDCLNIGGDWGGIDQMGCISLPGDVK